jgi:hypothetical protein
MIGGKIPQGRKGSIPVARSLFFAQVRACSAPSELI